MTSGTSPVVSRRPGPGRGAALLCAVVLVTGCATGSYAPGPLAAGAGVDEARARMGTPTGTYALADGRRRLEFARGPYGRHTYMLDFDAQGRLMSWEQVLSEKHFALIRPGQTRDDVLRHIGHPADIRDLSFQKRTLWSYRYAAPFCQWFQVSFDRQDVVVEAGYGPDPLCDDDQPPFLR